MLQQLRFGSDMNSGNDWSAMPASSAFSPERLLAAFRRQWMLVVAFLLIGVGLAYVALQFSTPLYTARTRLMMDEANTRLVDTLTPLGGAVADDIMVLSQVQLLMSDRIGMQVVDNLDLTTNQLFLRGPATVIDNIQAALRQQFVDIGLMAPPEPEGDWEYPREAASWVLMSNVEVRRIGRTYILEIAYTAPDPEFAATVASEIARTYINDKLESKFEATRRASQWLQTRIEELRAQSIASDLAVQKFRAENNLAGNGTELITDQNLGGLNSALIQAQADTADKKARYDRIEAIIQSGRTDAVVSESLSSSIINTIRSRYLDASKRKAEIEARLGPKHEQVIKLNNEMAEYERLMFLELQRIADSYLSDYNVAKTREDSLRQAVQAASGASNAANKTLVQLRELERESETYKTLYQNFLTRYQESLQQESFPITEARVIGEATPPTLPSYPVTNNTLMLGGFLGLLAGLGIAGLRELRERSFRTSKDVRDDLGLEFLGFTPLVSSSRTPVRQETDGPAHRRMLSKASTLGSYVLDFPRSSFTETLRSAKIACDFAIGERRPKIIGVISVLPSEGKSTVSLNFGELLASQGHKTLLIDGDLRNPGLTRQAAPHAKGGMIEAIVDGQPWQDLLLLNPDTRLGVLPTVLKRHVPHSADLLTSGPMDRLLQEAGNAFDYIVIDLPPLAPIIDVRAFASRVDAFVLVVEWGRTARSLVRNTLSIEPMIYKKCAGVVLNKADIRKMRLYGTSEVSEYYHSSFKGYYHNETPARTD